MILPPSRSIAEAHLYMDLRPCRCGQARFARRSAVVALDDGDLASRYSGECDGCGQHREFTFRLPAEPVAGPQGMRYGGDAPSQLIDPGEWLTVAEAYARSVTAPVQQAEPDLLRAIAALDEVMKFIPHGEDAVPVHAFTDRGRDVQLREPGRFRRDRLAAVRAAYAEMLPRPA
ncbi:hypothetical protein GA0070616_2319 [Micromonospora nigra]|uniref:Uncharacterized protein n=1 Tax=Micromonospora nigra TaxID=145857 RepID=A0A1C6RW87_9ACTN|nr:hypothetical protein [Micromonospora nigra]SCL21501.1 hypothetical protein GA0070616_2319 [Micromonospora nigra]